MDPDEDACLPVAQYILDDLLIYREHGGPVSIGTLIEAVIDLAMLAVEQEKSIKLLTARLAKLEEQP